MFEKHCIDVLNYIEQNGTIRTEQILEKLNIPTKYADAINSEMKSNGWVTLTKSGAIIRPAGSAYLAKLELSSPKQLYEQLLEFLQPNGIGVFVSINPVLKKHFHVNNNHDYTEIQQETRKIKDLLNNMVSNNLLLLDPNKYNHLGSGNTTEGFKWLDTTTINASIQPAGLTLLKENNQSFLHHSRPIEMPIHAAKNSNQNSFWLKTLKWIFNHIVQIILTLLVAYIVYRLGWNR